MRIMRYAPIDPSLFVENRRKLKALLAPNAIAVFNSNDLLPTNADGTHPFVQQTDFFYLSGIDQERSTLVIFPDAKENKHREILFIRETNEQIAVWEGKQYTLEEAAAVAGVSSVHWNREFEGIFRPLVLEADRIYLNTNEHSRSEAAFESRDTRFIRRCRRRFPLHRYERLAPLMHRLRAVKSPPEVELISTACRITGGAFRRLLNFVRPGVWEFEIEAEIFHEFIRNRSRGPAFSTIVASGAEACTLHYVKNDKQCREGDLVLIDFGAEYANYHADVTRTIPVSGKFSERQKAVYNAVLEIQKAAIDMLRPGCKLLDYQNEVGRRVTSALVDLGVLEAADMRQPATSEPPFKKYFPHGTSHHLGLDVHDVGSRHRPLEPGMVLTCEPGIYLPEEGIGVRIENDILVTEDAPVDLTADIPREIEDIEALMRP
jgi:Xaa-Pro aminopeptidase